MRIRNNPGRGITIETRGALKKMTRSQLITAVSEQTELSAADVERVMDSVFDHIIHQLQDGNKVTIAGFGRFEMRERQTKAYTNPKTKVSTQLAPTKIPGFKASGIMKRRLSGEAE